MISVIISTYKRPEKLKRAIKSVINQTYDEWELVVIDDASKDSTENTVKSFKDKRIKYIKRKKNFGTDTKPKNEGILASRGEYVAFLDDDNAYRPDHLSVLLKELENNPEVALVYGNRWVVDETGQIPGRMGISSDFSPSILLQQNYIDTSDVLIRRVALFDVGGFDERYKKYVDWNLWLRMAKRGYVFKRVNAVITDYYLHDGMKSQRPEDEKEFNVPAWNPYDVEIQLPYLGPIDEPRVAVFTLTYNRVEYTKDCFKSLKDMAGYPYDHFVVDNGSTDETVKYLKDGDFTVILNKDNKGISIASNQALNAIGDKYDIIVKYDNDCLTLTEGWLAKMVEIWKSNNMLALSCYVQGLRDNPGGAPRLGYGVIRNELLGMTQHLGGICHFVDARAYKNFRWGENDFKHGMQDLEFSKYLNENKYQMGYLENYFVEHIDGTEGQHKRYPEYFKKREEEKRTRYKG